MNHQTIILYLELRSDFVVIHSEPKTTEAAVHTSEIMSFTVFPTTLPKLIQNYSVIARACKISKSMVCHIAPSFFSHNFATHGFPTAHRDGTDSVLSFGL